jgi:hypothetical protein
VVPKTGVRGEYGVGGRRKRGRVYEAYEVKNKRQKIALSASQEKENCYFFIHDVIIALSTITWEKGEKGSKLYYWGNPD